MVLVLSDSASSEVDVCRRSKHGTFKIPYEREILCVHLHFCVFFTSIRNCAMI